MRLLGDKLSHRLGFITIKLFKLPEVVLKYVDKLLIQFDNIFKLYSLSYFTWK